MKTDKTSRNILIKVYKLIKEYPNCGYKLNQKIETDIIWINGQKIYLKDHPEFWEEVKDNNPLGLEIGKEYLLQYVYCDPCPQRVKITRFTKDGYPWMKGVISDVNGIVSPGYYKLIKEFIEEPLFTTEDDVDIFVGDAYWVLNTKVNDWIFEENAARDNINYFYKDKSYASQTKIYYFSTKEAAEEYVVMNKPCLSISDIIEHFNTHCSKDTFAASKAELVKLVKSKL